MREPCFPTPHRIQPHLLAIRSLCDRLALVVPVGAQDAGSPCVVMALPEVLPETHMRVCPDWYAAAAPGTPHQPVEPSGCRDGAAWMDTHGRSRRSSPARATANQTRVSRYQARPPPCIRYLAAARALPFSRLTACPAGAAAPIKAALLAVLERQQRGQHPPTFRSTSRTPAAQLSEECTQARFQTFDYHGRRAAINSVQWEAACRPSTPQRKNPAGTGFIQPCWPADHIGSLPRLHMRSKCQVSNHTSS